MKLQSIFMRSEKGKRKGILWAVLTEPIAVLPLYPNGTPHHVTLFYDVLYEDWDRWIDITFEAYAIGICSNNDVQAILLDMPSHIPHKARPHITVSYRDGVAPSASNQMLASGDYTFEPLKMAFRFKIEFFEFVKRTCNFCGTELAMQNHTEFCTKHRYKVSRMTIEEQILKLTQDIGTRYHLLSSASPILQSKLNVLQERDIAQLNRLRKVNNNA